MTEEMKEAIFREFNSLSVVFSAPSSTFIEKRAYHIVDDEGEGFDTGRLVYSQCDVS